jgi:hypothetical protein
VSHQYSDLLRLCLPGSFCRLHTRARIFAHTRTSALSLIPTLQHTLCHAHLRFYSFKLALPYWMRPGKGPKSASLLAHRHKQTYTQTTLCNVYRALPLGYLFSLVCSRVGSLPMWAWGIPHKLQHLVRLGRSNPGLSTHDSDCARSIPPPSGFGQ